MAKKRRLNRELVIAQAAALADEAGSVEAVSLINLAEALTIRPPSLYNHVDGLEDLRYGLAVSAARLLLAQLQS